MGTPIFKLKKRSFITNKRWILQIFYSFMITNMPFTPMFGFMNSRKLLLLLGSICFLSISVSQTVACCAVYPPGKPVLNADQGVIIIWDPATKTQHFIRKASFKSDAEDFGFLIPTPTQPQLEESGNEAFPFLEKLTAVSQPVTRVVVSSLGTDLGVDTNSVLVLEQKLVAGFDAVVLEANSETALMDWLKDHQYTFSPEVETWVKPYIKQGWKITALKVAKDKSNVDKTIAASALRMSFKTDRPLFPYREPDPKGLLKSLDVNERLLRIFFLSSERYDGLTEKNPWTGKAVWSNKLSSPTRRVLLELLKLPQTTGPKEFWLTAFEDDWPYQVAPSDLYFSSSKDQSPVFR
jgi:hypothetical protein